MNKFNISQQFKQRLLMGTLGVIGIAASIYFSFSSYFIPFFILINAGVISLALQEYYQLAQNKGFQPLTAFGIGLSIFYVLVVAIGLYDRSISALSSMVLLFSFLFLFLLFFKHKTLALGNLAITLFGIGYLTIPLSCALRINYFFPPHSLEDGRLWLGYVLLTSKITDVGAYFCGKILGKNKLAPSISPRKTVEGALGGLGAALITSVLYALIASHLGGFHMTLFQSVWIGLTISVISQLGDLSESLLKRDAGVKDSSHMPGFGGMLDVVDSVVFTLPFVYLLLQMGLIGSPSYLITQ